MNFLENLIHGKIAIHPEIINKSIKEAIAENQYLQEIAFSITEGAINARIVIHAGEGQTICVTLALSLGNYEFNRSKRFVELFLRGPAMISSCGLSIKARLSVDTDPDPSKMAGAPEGLISVLQYLNVKEDVITIDFNKIPGFNQALQKKLGFLLKNLEITKMDLVEEMIIIHPAIKFF
ncbi:MAG: hypothetical protein PHS52_03785 [Desulfotomaculaceae bacterium]|nr:hypothetical protein [Desulfotomaculaceae bacterium]